MHTLKLISFMLFTSTLIACAREQTVFSPVSYQPYHYDDIQLYTQSNYNLSDAYYGYGEERVKQVSVPDSYYLGANRSPHSHKELDKNWVNSRNPHAYTIEIADDEKAAQVAQKLHKAPKTNRMAEIRYQREGKAYYKGLYGSYKSKEAAEQALQNLPEDLKQGAGVKDWGSVQNTVNE